MCGKLACEHCEIGIDAALQHEPQRLALCGLWFPWTDVHDDGNSCTTVASMVPHMELTIALAQMHIAASAPQANMDRMERFVGEAVQKGAQLVVFPEDAICGPLGGQTAFIEQAPAFLARMQRIALMYRVDLVPGTWTVAEGGLCYNQAHYISADGIVLGTYRKIHLWPTEQAAITPGSFASVFPTRFGPVGLVICWDISFPPLFGAMNEQGVQLVIAPSYWSFTRPAGRPWRVIDKEVQLIDSLCIARAFENNVLFAYCNAAGMLKMHGVRTMLSGRSQLTHPLEKVLARCEDNKEQLLVVKAKLDRA